MSTAARRKRFGEYFRLLRVTAGYESSSSLGRASGLGNSHIAQLERGVVLPGWDAARKLARALHLENDSLIYFYRSIEVARRPDDIDRLLAGVKGLQTAEG